MGVYIGAVKNDYSAMQGPAPSGFHVPTKDEWGKIYNIGISLGAWTSSGGNNFKNYLKLPFAGYRLRSATNISGNGTNGQYATSEKSNTNNSYKLLVNRGNIQVSLDYTTFGYSVRGFKNSPIVPTSSWTKLYGTSIEGGGIFWSSTDGLISLSSDGATWITIMDKNLGATTVYNNGDMLSEANCGRYFQWGNNYGFPGIGNSETITTSSGQVNAQNYGPWNYYSSSTFITRSSSPFGWDSSNNYNLWGGVTGVKPASLKNAYIGEYKIPTSGLLAYRPLVSDANDHKADLGATGTTYNGTWGGTANYGTVGGKTAALFTRGSNRINTGLNRSSLPISICACFYHTTTDDWETIMGNPTGNNTNGFAIRYDGGRSKILINNGTGSDRDTTTSPTSNVWHSVVMTIQSGTTIVYLDGTQVFSSNTGSGGGSTFYIASYGAYTTYGWNGYIGDVCIYNRVLTADEALIYHNCVI